MSKIITRVGVDWYCYLYLFMIILYAGQSTKELCGLVGYSDNIIGVVIPIIMTLVLLVKHPVKFNNPAFVLTLGLLGVWFFIQWIVKGELNPSLTIFHFYQIIICYIIIQVFQEKFFSVYEDLIYKLCVLSLALWMVSVFAPRAMADFMHIFNNGKDNFSEGSILVYNMMTLNKVNVIIRNSGFAWEPGRFSCFICLAIYCNFLNNGFSLKKNNRLIVLVITALTTQSTTGLFTMIVLFVIFMINNKMKHLIFYALLFIPASIYLLSLEWGVEKLQNNIEIAADYSYHTDAEAERGRGYYSMDRFESMAMEYENFIQDPIIGYCEKRYSYFYQNIAQSFYSNNGTMQILAKYGLLGLLFYFCVFYSSKRMADLYHDKVRISYLLLFVLISMSYVFTDIIIVMAFSFWGVYMPDNKQGVTTIITRLKERHSSV